MLKPDELTALLRDVADTAAEDFWDGSGFHATGNLSDSLADEAIAMVMSHIENALRLKLLMIRAEHTQFLKGMESEGG